jgi:hypothetical protein
MYRHEPASTMFRVSVLRDAVSALTVGSMPASVGMVLTNGGTIVRVNEKSIVIRRPNQSDARESHPVSVTREEARKFGYPQRVPNAK